MEKNKEAVEVLREYKKNYELLRETGKKCITTNNVEVILIPYPEFCEACLALEKLPALKFELGLLRVYNRDYVMRLQKLDRLEKWLDKEVKEIKKNEKVFGGNLLNWERDRLGFIKEIRAILNEGVLEK